MTNDDTTPTSSNRANQSESKKNIKRRQLVQGMGMSLAAIAVLPSVEAKTEPETEPFDPNNTEEIDEYLDYYHSLSSSKKQQKAWEKLSDAQQRAFLERYIEKIETTSEGISNREQANQNFVAAEGASDDGDVSTMGIPVFYDDAVTAYYEGNKLYTWECEIQWEANPSSNTYTYKRRGWREEHNPDQNIDFVGLAHNSFEGHSTFFDVYQKGEFENTQLPLTYVAHLKLRGRADGTGETVYKDDGFPIEGA